MKRSSDNNLVLSVSTYWGLVSIGTRVGRQHVLIYWYSSSHRYRLPMYPSQCWDPHWSLILDSTATVASPVKVETVHGSDGAYLICQNKF